MEQILQRTLMLEHDIDNGQTIHGGNVSFFVEKYSGTRATCQWIHRLGIVQLLPAFSPPPAPRFFFFLLFPSKQRTFVGIAQLDVSSKTHQRSDEDY